MKPTRTEKHRKNKSKKEGGKGREKTNRKKQEKTIESWNIKRRKMLWHPHLRNEGVSRQDHDQGIIDKTRMHKYTHIRIKIYACSDSEIYYNLGSEFKR
jgi:hypothetical protein